MSDDSAERQKTKEADEPAKDRQVQKSTTSEQQQLSDDVPSDSKTVQERIMNLYNDNRLSRIIVGFCLKLIIEVLIVGFALGVILVIPAVLLRYAGILPYSYSWIIGGYIPLTGTILAGTWCFTEGATSDEEREKED
jgi:hypothetical protein